MLHGRFLAGLAARAVENDDHDPGMRIARLTVDMFRSPPMTAFTTRTKIVRDGRRVRVVDVSITCGEVEVAKATALMLRAAPHPDVEIWHEPNWDAPSPDTVPRPDGDAAPFGGWDFRLITEGGFWSTQRKRVWARDTWQLVGGEEPSPAVRAALASDLPNPLANSGAEGLAFINPDLTMFLARPPVSEWIGLQVTDHIGHEGLAIGSCTLYDVVGPIGASTVCGLANTDALRG